MHNLLNEITLGVIVRDELMNPAGGILPFIHYHAKHFPNITLLDTMSEDGTYELIQKITRDKYPHIKVFQTEFVNYSDARNQLIDLTDTKYSIQVDADERVSKELIDNLKIIEETEIEKQGMLTVNSEKIYTDGTKEKRKEGETCEQRIFLTGEVYFEKDVFEGIILESRNNLPPTIDGAIFHYEPFEHASRVKRKNIYLTHEFPATPADFSKSPFSNPLSWMWKVPGKKALKHAGIDFDKTIEEIQSYRIKFPEKYHNAWKLDEFKLKSEIFNEYDNILMVAMYF